MPKFRKKPVVIEAHRWRENGDHPEDDCPQVKDSSDHEYMGEGKIVRYFRRPDVSCAKVCKKEIDGRPCDRTMQAHGWIETLEGGHVVCPGDWIITGVQGERYPCKPDIFKKTYEAVEE